MVRKLCLQGSDEGKVKRIKWMQGVFEIATALRLG